MQSNHITPPAEMSSTQPVSQHSYILSALQGPMARPKFSTAVLEVRFTFHSLLVHVLVPVPSTGT